MSWKVRSCPCRNNPGGVIDALPCFAFNVLYEDLENAMEVALPIRVFQNKWFICGYQIPIPGGAFCAFCFCFSLSRK
uniref:Uncharacterized protein n=1 Tax=Arundo donax TaxID=35708 RepID=A0A0A9DWZ9_ARUDO